MQINVYRWKDMEPGQRARLMNRSQGDLSKYIKAVQPIVEDVRERGDAALIEYERKFNTVELAPGALRVSAAEFEAATAEVPADIRETIEACAANIRAHNKAALKFLGKGWITEIRPGVLSGEMFSPVDSIGLYIPGAKNSFPSTLLMLGIPANIAGVPNITAITQARPDGTVNPVTLYAAQVAGVTNLVKVSGAHGIAALGFGTQNVPKCSKIMGPSGLYAYAAKMILPQYTMVHTGFPAGPSESIVLCDGTAHPRNTALDVLNESEHGADSAGLLVTHDTALAEEVRSRLPIEIEALPEPQREYCTKVMADFGGIIVTDSLEESIDIVNRYAPEHVLVKVRDPSKVLPYIKNAGSILVGELTPNTLANFSLGGNHSLPTGQAALAFSGASLLEFMKVNILGSVTSAEGWNAVSGPAAAMAAIEGFPAHRNAVEKRDIADPDSAPLSLSSSGLKEIKG